MKKIVFIYIAVLLAGCKKNWLDAKPDNALVVPSTVSDYQALLDNSNEVFNIGQPAIGEMASDELYVTTTTWQSLFTATEKECYTWTEDGSYVGGIGDDWNVPYNQILNANIVIDGLSKVTVTNADQAGFNNAMGSALFFRAYAYFELAQIFCKPYTTDAATNPGLPLRLSSDINQQTDRPNLQKTYDQILADFTQAAGLLPELPKYKTRPSRAGAFAMLSRAYLAMQDYDNCIRYSDSCLDIQRTLMNYNDDPSITSYALNPFSRTNPEIIFYSTCLNYSIFSTSRQIVDSALYQLYDTSDLRRSLFFTTNAGEIRFRGSYDGTRLLFGGPSTGEIYLNRAESYARTGDVSHCLADLDSVHLNRIVAGDFTPAVASDGHDALMQVLSERRKELCFRGLRWVDLRRLNMSSDTQTTLRRILDNETYTLPPNDRKYVFPIPLQEIIASGIQQNP